MNFIRQCQLSVGGMTFMGGTRSQNLRIKFSIKQKTTQSPGILDCFVYNIASSTRTALKGIQELSPVTFSAGYTDGLYGTIFKGALKQVRAGKESPVDTYGNIIAADDKGYNWGTINQTVKPNSTGMDYFNALVTALQPLGVQLGFNGAAQQLAAIQYPRGLTLFGPVKEYMRQLAHSVNSSWSIQNGMLHMVPIIGSSAPGGPTQINVNTGMVGMPVQSIDGILHVRTLINPNIGVNQLVQLNNADIQEFVGDFSTNGVAQTNLANQAFADDGMYKVLAIEWTGDTMGAPWFMDLTCVSSTKGSVPGQAGAIANSVQNQTVTQGQD
jgi:hypothetical protein